MKSNRITSEQLLYILAFAIALGVRLLDLGSAPLSNFEAGWALQALEISKGENVTLGPEPGYVLLTGLTLFLFESSNVLARLWPALAGAGLVWLPYLCRRLFGQKAALIISFGLALDPALVALSRLAGGPMIAMGFGLLAIGLWYSRRPFWAGILGALSLLGGPAVIQGSLGLAVAWGIGNILKRFGLLGPVREDVYEVKSVAANRLGIIAGGGTILVAGTLFLKFPEGLSAIFETLPSYFNGWFNASGVPSSRLLAALIIYQPLAVIFGVVAAIRGWTDGRNLPRWLSLWFVAALVLSIVYPGRQVWDVAWALIPLWGLVGLELEQHFRIDRSDILPMFGEACLIIMLLALVWLNFTGLAKIGVDAQGYRLRWAVIVGALALGAVTTILVALGWSLVVAQRGLVWGLVAAFGLFGLSNLWGVSQLHPNGEQELWYPPPYTREVDSLLVTLGDLSEWYTGTRDSLEVVVLSDSPSLRWILRDWQQARFTSDPGVGELPPVIIKPDEQSAPSQTVAYRGQDFGLWAYPSWDGGLPLNWPRWLAFHEAPQWFEQVILWARGDVFPDGSLVPEGDSVPQFEEEENYFQGPVE